MPALNPRALALIADGLEKIAAGVRMMEREASVPSGGTSVIDMTDPAMQAAMRRSSDRPIPERPQVPLQES